MKGIREYLSDKLPDIQKEKRECTARSRTLEFICLENYIEYCTMFIGRDSDFIQMLISYQARTYIDFFNDYSSSEMCEKMIPNIEWLESKLLN